MLTISKPIKAGQGEYYLSLASTDDYYLSGTEPPGYWLGKGAIPFGLTGQIEREAFRHLLRGLSPDGTRKLVRNVDAERRAGWDFCWSVPKSVSVAWSQASSDIRDRMEECVHRAVRAGVDYLQSVGGISRRGEDGHLHEQADLIFAAFLHSTSRAQDPQLHVHTILLNVGVRPDGTTGTLEPRELYRHQMTAGTLFRAELACALEVELGLRCRREGRAFELTGVDLELMTHLSKRRAAIEAELARLGHSGGRAAEIANFATREAKQVRHREELFAEWQQIGREFHWSTHELSWLLDAPFPPRDLAWEKATAVEEAMHKLTQHESHFSSRQIIQAVAECCQGRGLDADAALRLGELILSSTELVRLGSHRGEIHYTTREILALEQSVIATSKRMHERQVEVPDASRIIERAIQRHPHLSHEQIGALRHLCSRRGGLALIHGMAGTGKSTLFATAREIWLQQGLVPWGAALSGKAARGLEEATGIASTTVHQLLSQLDRQMFRLHANSVLVLDEAAMIGTRQLARLVEHCHRSGTSLVLCGDIRQLQAVELGGLFAALTDRFETARLVEIHRQRDEWARESVKDFAFGRAERALSRYQERGLVAESSGTGEAADSLIEDWKREPDSSHCAMLAGTSNEVQELNWKAQALRREAGMLGTEFVQAGSETFFVGDRVLFTRNSRAIEVCNGDVGHIDGIRGRTVRISFDGTRQVLVDVDAYPHLKLGYGLTTHKAQGMTIEKSFVLSGDSMTGRELSYVQASRARGETHWYLSEDLEETARRMSRSHEKLAAMSLIEGPELKLNLVR